MSRSHFGGTSVDWMLRPYRIGQNVLVALRIGTTVLKFYDAETGGTRYTDLLDASGTGVDSITVVGHQIPRLQGPDLVVGMWADKGDGSPREYMEARNPASTSTSIDDAAPSDSTTYSSSKINQVADAAQAAAQAAVLGGAGAGYDTLQEMKDLLDAGDAASLDAASALVDTLSTQVTTRAAATPYVIYIDTATRLFGPIPTPRPAPVITFNATQLLDFDPATEAPTDASHPTLETGDILEFYYEGS